MLRVRKEDLRLGMFIQSLEGSWFEHPFWKTKFLLEENDDLRALQSSDVDAVWIDEAKSLAPAIAHLAAPDPEQSPIASLRAELGAMEAAKQTPAPATPRIAAAPKPRPETPANEFETAEQLMAECKAAVGELFAKVRSGSADAAIADAAPVVSGIAQSIERNPDAFLTLARVRSLDEYTYMHSLSVSALMINLARQLQLPPDYAQQAGTAGLFMDIGKGFLEPALLTKSGGYSDADWSEMKRHPKLAADSVKATGDLSRIVADVCLSHHERCDGSGYPHGLRGDEISLFARMAAICDTYDALASARPHRPAMGPSDAVAELYKLKGQFDDGLLNTFIRSVGIYPVGSLVRLETRRLACVAAQRRDALTKPVVRVFYSIPERRQLPVDELDLSAVPEPDKIVAREEPGRWGLRDWDRFALTILQGQRGFGRKQAA